jgi:hypothetical protein
MGRRAFPVLLLAATACGDPGSPCTDPACAPDLVLASVEVVSDARDAETGLRVVQPAGFDVRFTVSNEGSARSPATLVSIEMKGRGLGTAPVPALAPGVAHTASLRVEPALGRILAGTDTARVEGIVVAIEDDVANNARSTEPFHIALPVLDLETSFDSLRLTVNVAATARVRVTNRSRHGALPPSTLGLCLYELGTFCRSDAGAAAVARVSLPAVGPGETRLLEFGVAVPSTAAHQNAIDAYHLSTCIGGADLQAGTLLEVGMSDCVAPLQVFVRPDYESCDPPLLQPDTRTSSSPVCVRPCPIFVYTVDAQPGYTYRVERPNGTEDTTLRWRTRHRDDVVDASDEPGLQVATAGRIYAVTALRFCSTLAVSRDVVLRRTGSGAR